MTTALSLFHTELLGALDVPYTIASMNTVIYMTMWFPYVDYVLIRAAAETAALIKFRFVWVFKCIISLVSFNMQMNMQFTLDIGRDCVVCNVLDFFSFCLIVIPPEGK